MKRLTFFKIKRYFRIFFQMLSLTGIITLALRFRNDPLGVIFKVF